MGLKKSHALYLKPGDESKYSMICGSGINLWRKVCCNGMHQTEKGGKLANIATTAMLIFFAIHL